MYYKWIITKVGVLPNLGTLSNVANTVDIKLVVVGKDDNITDVVYEAPAYLLPPSTDESVEFTKIEALTQDQLIAWGLDTIGESKVNQLIHQAEMIIRLQGKQITLLTKMPWNHNDGDDQNV